MQFNDLFKKLIPHLWVMGVFIIISCLFCLPAFQGKTIWQHDIKTWKEMSKESRDFYNATGENAHWANNMFSGMPLPTTDLYSNANWYHKLYEAIQFYTHGDPTNPAVFFIISMVCFYILMQTIGISRWISAIAAIAFAFSTYNPIIIGAGHTTKMLDIAFLPTIFAGIILAYKGKYWQGSALAGVTVAFAVDSGHYQILYYGCIVVGVLAIGAFIYCYKNGLLKRWAIASALLLVAAGLGAMVNSSRLLLAQEFTKHTIRGGSSELAPESEKKNKGLDKDYAFRWSMGVGESFSILAANLYGGASSENIGEDSHLGEKLASLGVPPHQISQITSGAPTYWGPQQDAGISGPVYFGAVVCFLMVLGLFLIRSPYKWVIFGVGFFFLLLSLGNNFSSFNFLLFDYFPLLNKFRTPSMALSITSICVPIIAFWGLHDYLTGDKDKSFLFQQLKKSLLVTGGVLVLMLVATQTTMDYKGKMDQSIAQQFGQAGPELMSAIREDRKSMATKDVARSLFFVALAGAALWGYSRSKLSANAALVAVGLVVAIDLIPVAYRYLNEDKYLDDDVYAMQFEPNSADLQILNNEKDEYYRVFDLTGSPFNDARAAYIHKSSIGGYHGSKLQIYQDLIEHQLSQMNQPVLNMLNTKYFIVRGNNGQPMAQKNPGALGNAWFVSNIQWVNTATEEMNALNGPSLNNPQDISKGNFNPEETAIVRKTFEAELANKPIGKDSTAYIKLVPNGYKPNKLVFESNNSQAGLGVFSDIYYPDNWTAKIDGQEVPIIRANYVLRALYIPAGKHTIEFSYFPQSFVKGERLALIGSILLTVLVALGLFKQFYKKS